MNFEKLRKKAENKDIEAMLRLARCYKLGCDGAEQNTKIANELYEFVVAEPKNHNIMTNLAALYRKGDEKKGIEQDDKEARALCSLAADQGDAVACHYLGFYYERGVGGGVDRAKAVEYYRRAADKGVTESQFNWACLERKKNPIDALKFYRAAVDKNHTQAQHNMACFYLNGNRELRVKKNATEAVRLFKLAAAKKFALSQEALGECYEHGWGVDQDLPEALRFYKLAAKQGGKGAEEAVKRLEKDKIKIASNHDESDKKAKKKAKKTEKTENEAAVDEALEEPTTPMAEQKNVDVQPLLEDAPHNTYDKRGEEQTLEEEKKEVLEQYDLRVLLDRAIDEADIEARLRLAKLYMRGCDEVPKNPSVGLKLYLDATKQWKDLVIIHNLAIDYLKGNKERGIEKDPKEAVTLFSLAANRGYAKALHGLGRCYLSGEGVGKDEEKAVGYFGSAALQENRDAQFALGVCFQYGQGVNKDTQKAVRNYELAAAQGHMLAQFNLAICYRDGEGTVKNMEKAARNFRLAAEQGHAIAQFCLGVCYKNGEGVAKDMEEAVRLFRLAADQKDSDAQFALGVCLDNGCGVDKDPKEAVLNYKRAAEQKHMLALFNLAVCYKNGYEVEKDLPEAVRLFKLSADQKCADAQHALGLCYENGMGVPKDLTEAMSWYQLAANNGNKKAEENVKRLGDKIKASSKGAVDLVAEQEHKEKPLDENAGKQKQMPASQCAILQKLQPKEKDPYILELEKGAKNGEKKTLYELAHCYATGNGVEKNPQKAKQLYKRAAQKNDSRAHVQLGLWYVKQQKMEKATNRFLSAAGLGNTAASYIYGWCSEQGWGRNKDKTEAKKAAETWYRYAATDKKRESTRRVLRHFFWNIPSAQPASDLAEFKDLYRTLTAKK